MRGAWSSCLVSPKDVAMPSGWAWKPEFAFLVLRRASASPAHRPCAFCSTASSFHYMGLPRSLPLRRCCAISRSSGNWLRSAAGGRQHPQDAHRRSSSPCAMDRLARLRAPERPDCRSRPLLGYLRNFGQGRKRYPQQGVPDRCRRTPSDHARFAGHSRTALAIRALYLSCLAGGTTPTR